ncbi:MAG: asparagine synthetase B [Anaerolineaceae bacterium]|nr:asparagine synthetase B [Anaerolineaceae bacterium]
MARQTPVERHVSGIFGIFQLDGAPVDPADMQRMMAAMAHWGPDGRSQLIAGPVAFGQLLLNNTPQAHREHLPRQTASGLLLTAEARLDNRAGLCQQLNIANPDREYTTDSQLIERAYDKWGEGCPDHLLGDWSLAVWNPQTQRLFVARDHHGNTALYYFQDDNRFAFASCRDALLALGVPRRLNELFLAKVLVSWPHHPSDQTIDQDVHRLPPAHAMTITPAQTAVWRYWRLEDTPELHLPTFEEYVTGFLEVYGEAVNGRLRSSSPVAVTLSGGLDSGSVTALAARNLKAQNQRLAAYTAVPLYDTQNTVGPNRFGDETEFARETAAFHPNIDWQRLDARGTDPLEGLRRSLAINNEPGHAGANFYWIADLLQTAQAQGIGTLLTGQGGNASISWTGAPELASLRMTWREKGWKTAVKQALPFFALRALLTARANRQIYQGSAILPAFAERLHLRQRYIAAVGRNFSVIESHRSPLARRFGVIEPGSSLLGSIWAEFGAAHQLEVRDPTQDKRVLMFTISVPDHFFTGPEGQDRWLIRSAMAGFLPDTVRLNSRRGRQAADLGQRLCQISAAVDQALEQVAQSEAVNYLDLPKMRAAWQAIQVERSLETTQKAVTILLRGLNAGLFFTGFVHGKTSDLPG